MMVLFSEASRCSKLANPTLEKIKVQREKENNRMHKVQRDYPGFQSLSCCDCLVLILSLHLYRSETIVVLVGSPTHAIWSMVGLDCADYILT